MELTRVAIVESEVNDKALLLDQRYRLEREYLKHVDAETVDEAIAILREFEGGAKIIAGGTDLLRLLRNNVKSPMVLVNIKTIPGLANITEDDRGLKIGMLTTLYDIETSPIIKDEYSMLAEAAHLVASPQIRNMATISGNLCQDVNCWYYRMPMVTGRVFTCRRKGGTTCCAVAGDNRYHAIMGGKGCFAVSTSDIGTALVALNARMKIIGPDGERIIQVEDFFTPWGNILKAVELITEIQIPSPKPSAKQRYLKFRVRKAIDPALSSVAAVISMDEGVVTDARIVLGGVAPMPYRSFGAEKAIIGKAITESVSEMAARVAMREAIPLSMNYYKIPITETLIKRAILD